MSFGLAMKNNSKVTRQRLGWLFTLALSTAISADKVTAYPWIEGNNTFNGLITSVQSAKGDGSGTGKSGSGGGGSDGPSVDSADYFASEVHPLIKNRCFACHLPEGLAESGGATLIFKPNGTANQTALNFEQIEAFINQPGGGSRLLGKVSGTDHGGGLVYGTDSEEYDKFKTLVDSLTDTGTAITSVWDGAEQESRTETLRRASILFAARLPTEAELNAAARSDGELRTRVKNLMKGEEFERFIKTGANDKLLVGGLRNGAPFDYDFVRFPGYGEESRRILSQYGDLSSGNQEARDAEGDWNGRNRNSYWQEPLELISYIVTNDRPYTEVLTADYTVVNGPLNQSYQSGNDIDLYDMNTWVKGRNKGTIVHDDQTEWEEFGNIISLVSKHSGLIEMPHAGILTTPAWLARFPSTETNRNRARSRWTYMHFLGVDIENSAPRTNDPDALADTNNPTMNNPNCTVCHERLDPIAGSYQAFGNAGNYLDAWGGKDSLPDTYKYPEWFDGEPGSTGYVEGDTWYADMRDPGMEGGTKAPSSEGIDTLPWLAKQIVNDPRFPIATVKFWWPTVMGNEPLKAPNDEGDPDYEALLAAYDQQTKDINTLATRFKNGGYKLKDLLADMVLSPWYRTSGFDMSPGDPRWRSMQTAGSGQVLTPENLDRKTQAVVGRRWGYWSDPDNYWDPEFTQLTSLWAFRTLYGGTDSVGIKKRNRDMTAVMSNIAERHATEFSCAPVILDFNLPASERKLFTEVERSERPDQIATASFDLTGGSDWEKRDSYIETYKLTFEAKPGSITLAIGMPDLNDQCIQIAPDEWRCNHLVVAEVRLKRGSSKVLTKSGVELIRSIGYGWEFDTERGYGTVDWYPARIPFDIATGGTYTLEVDALGWFPEEEEYAARGQGIVLEARDNTPTVTEFENSSTLIQIDKLIKTFLGEVDDLDEERETILNILSQRVATKEAQKYNGEWADTFFGENQSCDTWNLGEEWQQEFTNEEWWERFQDTNHTMTAWSAVVAYLMNHYEYIHD